MPTMAWLMRKPSSHSLRITLALACTVSVTVAAAAMASAKPGGAYSGSAKQNMVGITIGVSSKGTKVTNINMIYLPTFCPGGVPVRNVKFKSADIRDDRFTATGKEYGPSGEVIAKATMTGKFLSKKREQGKLTVKYLSLPGCSGTTSYETKLVQLPG
jgi:hypothetical protein